MMLDAYNEQLQALCKKHKVTSLFAFGSVLKSTFAAHSDIDFVVDFEANDPFEYGEHYFELKDALENLLNRPIDLLEGRAIRNPLFREAIDKTKVAVYAA